MQWRDVIAVIVALCCVAVPIVAIDCEGVCDNTSCDFLENFCLNKVDVFSGLFQLPDLRCQANGWGVLLEIFIFLYSMLGLAIVCDDHMVAALERVCDVYMIREDVAGATFMAFGSAAPEIIINMVGSIKQAGSYPPSSAALDATNIGVGAILGSGMIAFLVIPAACAYFSGKAVELRLKRRPLLRDVASYAVILLLLCIFMQDGVIKMYEALIMVMFYVCYVLVVIWAPTIRRSYRTRILQRPKAKRKSFVNKGSKKLISDEEDAVEGGIASPLLADSRMSSDSTAAKTAANTAANTAVVAMRMTDHSPSVSIGPEEEEDGDSSDGEQETIAVDDMVQVLISEPEDIGEPQPVGSGLAEEDAGDAAEHGGTGNRWGLAKKHIKTFIKSVSRPLCFLFELTCPNCDEGSPGENWYPVTFIAAFLWVSFFSNVISACVVRWTNFTPAWAQGSFFGLVTIAVGAEIPDMIQSVTMAKRGYGSMAVSNALGSQLINIGVGLGLPWLIVTLSQKKGQVFRVTDHVDLQTAAYFQFGAVSVNFILLLGLAVYTKANKAFLTPVKGYLLLASYVVVICAYIGVMLRNHGQDTPCPGTDDVINGNDY